MTYNIEDISLKHLERNSWVSIRTINICRTNKLTGVKDIIAFYNKNGSFKNLKNCGEKTERELSEICNRFRNHRLDGIIENVIGTNEIKKLNSVFGDAEIKAANNHIEYLISNLSVRGRNRLLSLFNGIPKSTEFLQKTSSPSFSFGKIRNIGEKTTKELESLRESLLIFINKFQIQENELAHIENSKPRITILDDSPLDIVSAFNPFKKAALNRHIEYLVSNLKIRARNGITQFFGETFSAKEIVESIYTYSFDFQDIKNIGSKTVSELNDFKRDISSFIETLRFIEDNKLSREYAKLIVKTTFSNLPINFDEQFENVFDNTGKIKLFKLIYFLVENGQLLKQKEKELFYFLYTVNSAKSLDQIAAELDLGRERLRQIKITFEHEIQNYFRFILSFNLLDLVSYNITTEPNFKIIDIDFIQKINISEDVKFNVLFYSIVFGLFLENSHSVLGDDETISGKGNYSNTIRYKNCYIIDNATFHSFDFKTFTNDVSINLFNRITETYALHFEGYLLQFIKKEGKQYLSKIKQTCEAIIFNEFDLVVNNEGYLVFERNIRKPIAEYIVEILETLGQMTKVNVISKAINEKYPELETTEQSLRGTLQREKELFIYIGRTSTYGLKKWQDERTDLKGGTIRDIVEEFLNTKIEPMHITEIMKYVLKFRKTNEYSVKTNIELEENKRFQFFAGDFVGLKGKQYTGTDKYKKVSGSHFRISVFESMNGWDLEDVVNYFVSTFHYRPIQVKALIEKKFISGELSLTSNNKLKI